MSLTIDIKSNNVDKENRVQEARTHTLLQIFLLCKALLD